MSLGIMMWIFVIYSVLSDAGLVIGIYAEMPLVGIENGSDIFMIAIMMNLVIFYDKGICMFRRSRKSLKKRSPNKYFLSRREYICEQEFYIECLENLDERQDRQCQIMKQCVYLNIHTRDMLRETERRLEGEINRLKTILLEQGIPVEADIEKVKEYNLNQFEAKAETIKKQFEKSDEQADDFEREKSELLKKIEKWL